LGDLSIDGYNDVYINPDDELGLIKGWIAALLVIFDLLPDDFGNAISPGSQLWLDSPLPPKSVRGVGVSQRWKGLEHQGVDFVCHQGSSVVAVADGVRVKPSSPWYTYDGNGWGYALWLDHGGVYSFYGHLSAFSIDFDEKVKKGQEIGKCGNTGNSTGPHVHFAVSVKHPDKFVKWNDTGAWRDPDLYLGKEVNPKNKE
jgi:murein DD-endopeptidase MepM/ murein hydrolase activator NlpD